MKKNNIELLSPAGSFDSLQAAINAGADAVYFGVEQLNMRAKSVNSFGVDDIARVADIARVNNIKAYLTLNTIIYGHDLQLLRSILTEVKKHGIDAVIASDFAVIEQCSQMGIPLHISTQANVSNIEAVQFFSRFADVIVLARELTLKQVHDICNEVRRKGIKGVSGDLVKIEVFIHGALCMAVSGKCYMSLHTQNASANRGACTQNCRRPYLVKDAETQEELLIDNEYIMSPKDLCTIGVLDQIIRCGVDVLKIEGRSKGADYVHVTTQCYREALDALESGNYTADKIEAWLRRLSTVYNRGFWEGYYLGHKLGEWTSQPGSAATEKKIYVGKGSNYYPKTGIAEFTVETGSIKPGDTLMITGPLCGMVKEKAQKLVINGRVGTEAVKGDKITIPFGIKVGRQDKLYKIVEAANG
ncbi:peptidase U32 family protein [Mucilaginibacter gotjawali]|uniref:Protease n=2 Tax=Mucilaginibacter gotjawali TaxID=1550579 RepID=A0A839SFP1_9SPHI|nr:peptidase U32 family protein [Mucilaginibacter gotjawali]MBB3055357.1 putative protease [Mucilaginibacter gotjawali]BAU53366.1 putative protease YhbU precursor [Mucilaginibacter gotjawali]